MAVDYDQIKQVQRAMWSAGDYPDAARQIESAAEELVARSDIEPGHKVLDVATGSGNCALVAAQSGATVTGLDITPPLLDAARRRCDEAGVAVTLIEGDAEALPFEGDSFDRVLSVFGVMFAPRHEQAAGELVRVCRPGGLIGVVAWTPEGVNGRMFKTVGSYMPPPPPEVKPPTMWGNEDYVRNLFQDSGAELTFARRMVTFAYESPEAWFEYSERVLGPLVMARAALEPQGKWDALRADLVELFSGANQATDGSMRVEAEYLVTIARLPA
jgi:ubiquinone/menaquinone biosynthesis C-methylase UbiE